MPGAMIDFVPSCISGHLYEVCGIILILQRGNRGTKRQSNLFTASQPHQWEQGVWLRSHAPILPPTKAEIIIGQSRDLSFSSGQQEARGAPNHL